MELSVRQQLLLTAQKYKMPKVGAELLRQNPPLILAGITAAGKETIARQLEAAGNWRQITTHTTRAKRPGEKDGIDYWFVTEAQMLNLLSNSQMFEVQLIHGETFYGSSLKSYQQILAANHQPLFVMDVQGVLELSKQVPDFKAYFLLPPSAEVWLQRLQSRGKMSAQEQKHRFRSALTELQTVLTSQNFEFLINQDAAKTAQKIINSTPDDQKVGRELAKKLRVGIQSLLA